MKQIPYGLQDIDDEDIEEVVRVLRSDRITQGPAIGRFEQAMCHYCDVAHAVAVCNATAALHLACRILGLGAGDTLWTSPNTFVASANCALYCGANVDFVDIDPRTYNMSLAALEAKLEHARRTNTLPKIVVPVHFAGQPCEMKGIAELAQRYGFSVIEDAAHAIGAEYRNEKVGSCRYSDITVFSFHPVKIITTGEGGMLTTRSRELHEKMQLLRSHGITREPARMTGENAGGWYYEQISLGYNYRMTDIQAALGASQLRKLDSFVRRRHAIARRYDEELKDLPVIRPWQHPDGRSAYHLYPIKVDPGRARTGRRTLFEELHKRGIMANVHYMPVHTQPYYRNLGFREKAFPTAEAYYEHALSLPMYSRLGDGDQSQVIRALQEILR